jgi:RNA polymerase sigma-70 factor (ECF subfamily)
MEAPTTIADEEHALRAAAGAVDSFEVLVERYGARLLAVLERQIGEHHVALDLAQEVWIKVFRTLDRFRAGSAFRPWLFTIALNHLRDAHRRAGRSRVVSMEDHRHDAALAAAEDPRADPRAERDERAAIAQAMGRVAEPFRTALGLVDVGGLTYEEAAQTLECAVGTVKSRVHRGRLLLRDHYLKLSGGGDRVPAARSPRRLP